VRGERGAKGSTKPLFFLDFALFGIAYGEDEIPTIGTLLVFCGMLGRR
jgi:hypothetical protein